MKSIGSYDDKGDDNKSIVCGRTSSSQSSGWKGLSFFASSCGCEPTKNSSVLNHTRRLMKNAAFASVTQSFEVVQAPWDIENASVNNPMPCVPPRCHSSIMPGQNLQTRDERDSLVDPILLPRD
jgi:hypothetical protein